MYVSVIVVLNQVALPSRHALSTLPLYPKLKCQLEMIVPGIGTWKRPASRAARSLTASDTLAPGAVWSEANGQALPLVRLPKLVCLEICEGRGPSHFPVCLCVFCESL